MEHPKYRPAGLLAQDGPSGWAIPGWPDPLSGPLRAALAWVMPPRAVYLPSMISSLTL